MLKLLNRNLKVILQDLSNNQNFLNFESQKLKLTSINKYK